MISDLYFNFNGFILKQWNHICPLELISLYFLFLPSAHMLLFLVKHSQTTDNADHVCLNATGEAEFCLLTGVASSFLSGTDTCSSRTRQPNLKWPHCPNLLGMENHCSHPGPISGNLTSSLNILTGLCVGQQGLPLQ